MAEKPIAYETYQKLAADYDRHIENKPHNAYYDRPAVLSLLPEIHGKKVLDAGCGPGIYSREFLQRGAKVTACDVSENMIDLARQRVPNGVDFRILDLTQPLVDFEDGEFEFVVAPLCLDYIEHWLPVFQEFFRVLRAGGVFIFSCAHPSFDAEYFQTENYFSVEYCECDWTGFGTQIRMPGYRRSLEELVSPLIGAGFTLDRLHEPKPTEEFRQADPVRFERLMRRPSFVCIRAIKPGGSDEKRC